MCADFDISKLPRAAEEAPRPGPSLRGRLAALDMRLFENAAEKRWPGAERILPGLSRAANHGVLWFAVGGALAATGSPRARRAALRGVASLALASATINTLGKRSG
ncbi:phosphoesterase, partial [Streptomyces kunmingensis]|nr:phosphoesterase [Streptomyces kunmingensis]